MRAIIIANGDIPDTSILHEHIFFDDIIICCDGGLNYVFAEGITPHYVLGDLDSAYTHIINFYKSNNNIKFIEYNIQKDETDLELCIDFVASLGVEDVIIFGGIGTRFDHSLTNVNLLIKAINSNLKACIINENNIISVIDKNTDFNKNYINYVNININQNISLIPLSTEVTGVTTKGLYYSLENHTMKIGHSLGVSNIILEDINNINISISSGYLLIILVKD